jgi:hypothetical protein
LTLPIPVARFSQRHVSIGVVVTERMFLATLNVLGPVARMSAFVVQETTDAELFSGGSVPTCPIPGARSFMAEDAIEPVAVFRSNWWVGLLFAVTIIGPPRVVAPFGNSPVFTSKD